nr:hypothetical protein GCM10020092_055080 [Actinoplanes digitatis]
MLTAAPISGGGVPGRVQSRARSTVTRPSRVTSSLSQQVADDADAFEQPGLADLLARPRPAGDVLVAVLAAAQGGPEPARVHRAKCADRLRDDRRVVALSGRVDHAERQAGGL